ncbi:MAG: phosphoribosylanthranilate isomerase [Chromatiaceae bacterium]
MRTRVKICGLTCEVDLRAAAELGADAIGLVFHAPSPRAVGIEEAGALCACLPPFVTRVGLFVDAEPERVRATLERVALDLLQFHGEEPPEYCAAFGRPWIKAIRMRPDADPRALRQRYAAAAGLLLDAYDPVRAGGTGQCFDWDLVPADLAPHIVLAGGLDPGNVAEAIRRVRPYAVDVSGGVEAGKGIKDRQKMAAFMKGVNDGDRSR